MVNDPKIDKNNKDKAFKVTFGVILLAVADFFILIGFIIYVTLLLM